MKNTSVKTFSTNKLGRWMLVFLVGLIALASYWLLEITRNWMGDDTLEVRTRPDYYVENFNFVKMPPEGQQKYRVVGAKLVHFPNDDHAEITLPVVTSIDSTQPPMTGRADRATIKNIANQTESEVHLYDNVVLRRDKTQTTQLLQINTHYLVAYPDKNTVETDAPVKIISGNTITTGIGLKANNLTQQIEILKNVDTLIPPR